MMTLLAGATSAALVANETTSYQYDALGRLIKSTIAGGPNNATSTATCFDPAGNRSRYFTGTSTVPTCGVTPTPSPTPTPGPAPTPTPGPTPTPTPTGTNQPPVAVTDALSLRCYTDEYVDLLVNDSDPENNAPLVLVSISRVSGTSTASVSGSRAFVSAFDHGSSVFSYVVADSLGASSTGQLNVTVTGPAFICDGGGTNSVTGNTTDGGDGTDASGDPPSDPGNVTDPDGSSDVPGARQ